MQSKFDAKYYRVTFTDWDGFNIPASIIHSAINRPMVREVDFIIDDLEYDDLRLVMVIAYAYGAAPSGIKFRLSIPRKLNVELPLPIEVFIND